MATWLFHIPHKRPLLTSNQRLHWAKRAEHTRHLRRLGEAFAELRGIPELDRVDVTLTWVVSTRRRRDADNIVPTLKALCDGLVDAGVVPDDTPDLMVKHMPVIRREYGATPHLELVVTSLPKEMAA